jgi:hypothetical protein
LPYGTDQTLPRAGLKASGGNNGTVMNATKLRTPLRAAILALIAIAFGAVTVVVGGRILFGGVEATAAAGNVVPFVLWFNFVAGFAYVVAGIGLILRKRWAAHLSVVIAVATVTVFIALGIHILMGLAFEMRTVGAMTIRSIVWVAIAVLARRELG